MSAITAEQAAPQGQAGQQQEPISAGASQDKPQEPKSEPEKLSPHFAALARKEKALRLEMQKLKLERENIKAEREKFKTSDFIPRDRLSKETLQVLAEAGLSQDHLANLLLNGEKVQAVDPKVAKLEAQVQDLLDKLNKNETESKENQSKAYDQAVNQIRNDVKILIDADPAYETIKARNKSESVVKYIQRVFNESGNVLDIEQAAREIEEGLREETKGLLNLSYFKPAQPEPVAIPKQQSAPRQQQPTPTLTRDMVSVSTKPVNTPKERVRRAILVAQGLDPDTGKPRAGGVA